MAASNAKASKLAVVDPHTGMTRSPINGKAHSHMAMAISISLKWTWLSFSVMESFFLALQAAGFSTPF
jgi:hypothetical protein